MAHLACVGSHAINGVAELHSRLLGETVLRDFHELMPEKFQNKTNGVTPRRFMMIGNPELSALLTRVIGPGWVRDLGRLREVERYADDPAFQSEWRRVKRARKEALAERVRRRNGITLDPDHLFDVLAKRIHEYKRQHLKILHVITLYHRLKRDPLTPVLPRTCLFGGKAAPGYAMAKLILKLIHSVAEVVDRDPDIGGRLKVAFLPDFNVKLAQWVYPAADLSEQISTAGKEASGTGNMKFALNGALTVGTLDGANVEIRRDVGEDNFFVFGLDAGQVAATLASGYRPAEVVERNPELKTALDLIASGVFSHGDTALFRPLLDDLFQNDRYLVLADYASYVACQDRIAATYRDTARWTRMSILNTARMGGFSSDRTIREYCRDIWDAKPVPVELEEDPRPRDAAPGT
jgi:starch phosphorylase